MYSHFPQLQMRYDPNGIPVSAKCSACGKEMPQAKPRLIKPMENVAWIAAQFDLHVRQMHPPAPVNKPGLRKIKEV
jgi:hypothetical protein